MRFYQFGNLFFEVVMFMATAGGISFHVLAQDTGRLIIIGCPESAVVSVDNTIIHPDIGGWYEVPVGDRLIELHEMTTLVYYKNMTIKAGEDHKIIFGCVLNCARLVITSTPDNAKLTLDGESIEITPYVNHYMKDGSHSYSLTLPGYESMTDTFTLKINETKAIDLTMDRSQAYKDSVTNELFRERRFRQRVFKLVFGTLAVVTGGVGAYYEMSAQKSMKKANESAALYDEARTGFSRHRNDYYHYRDDAVKDVSNRNIFYGASGVMLLGVGLSFFF